MHGGVQPPIAHERLDPLPPGPVTDQLKLSVGETSVNGAERFDREIGPFLLGESPDHHDPACLRPSWNADKAVEIDSVRYDAVLLGRPDPFGEAGGALVLGDDDDQVAPSGGTPFQPEIETSPPARGRPKRPGVWREDAPLAPTLRFGGESREKSSLRRMGMDDARLANQWQEDSHCADVCNSWTSSYPDLV